MTESYYGDYGKLKTEFDTVCMENDALYDLLDMLKDGYVDWDYSHICPWCSWVFDKDNRPVHDPDCPYYKLMHEAGRL